MSDNPNFPVSTAVISWFDKGGAFHLRVYSTDGYTVTEMADDGNGWVQGFQCQGSDVSATCWNDSAGTHIRLYCTFDDTTTEWCNDPDSGWTQGSYKQP